MRRRLIILATGAAALVPAAAVAAPTAGAAHHVRGHAATGAAHHARGHASATTAHHLRGRTSGGHAIRLTADGRQITSLAVVANTFCGLTGSTRTVVRIRTAKESKHGTFSAKFTARNGIKVWIKGRITGRHARGTIVSAVDVGENICRGAARWTARG